MFRIYWLPVTVAGEFIRGGTIGVAISKIL